MTKRLRIAALILAGGSAATGCGAASDTFDSVSRDDSDPAASSPVDNTDAPDATDPAPITPPATAVPTTEPAPTTSRPPLVTVATTDKVVATTAAPISTSTGPAGDGEFDLDPSSSPVQATVADLAERLQVDPGDITIVEARAVTWGDSSLGCPIPGMVYLQRVTDGSRVVLRVDGVDYLYTGGSPLQLCEQPATS